MTGSNPIIGTGLHALGGVSASTCYLPFQGTKKWSWGTFWLVQASFAWIIMPIVLGVLTVPGYFGILADAPSGPFWGAFLLGGLYGFGGMSFGLAIRHVGYSLTYTISIGISAVVGTILPLIIFGGLTEYFARPGGGIVLVGMVLSVLGVLVCGWAGFRKERDLTAAQGTAVQFHMAKGLVLTIIAGVLSGVFNVSLEVGQPIADLAAQHGAGNFQGNAKQIVSTAGCFVVNAVWFLVAGLRDGSLKEFTVRSGLAAGVRTRNALWSALAGILWSMQFFFYGLGHVQMGSFQFVSWVLHMSMLIFFSYGVGMIMKEWSGVHRTTYAMLVVALLVLVVSFVITSYGSYYGEQMMAVH